jgi:hypothetical protein
MNSLLKAIGRFVSGWDLTNPPASVGGIQELGVRSHVGWI